MRSLRAPLVVAVVVLVLGAVAWLLSGSGFEQVFRSAQPELRVPEATIANPRTCVAGRPLHPV
jgi:hypothetical protein